jgi:hypothetical protein
MLEMSRCTTPIALGASGALGAGWDTPRSVKIDHAPVGIMLFMRPYEITNITVHAKHIDVDCIWPSSDGIVQTQNTHEQGSKRGGSCRGGGAS